jgi:glutaredoxin
MQPVTSLPALAMPAKSQVRALWLSALLSTALLCSTGCKREPAEAGEGREEGAAQQVATQAQPSPIKPPFDVTGELEGMLMVWFDADGLHTAQKRSEIPEAQRAAVRIDSLNAGPDTRLDPDHVYVADLRKPAGDGSYPVQKATREWFDAQVDKSKPQPAVEEASVIIYKAAWCGVCRNAANYLRSRHVQFVEKDVEKEPGASDEMLKKAQAKGLRPSGVPVIDFRGELMLGFDQARLSTLIDRYAKPI